MRCVTLLFITLLSSFNATAGMTALEALSMIESGDDDAAVGAAGEISRYQIQPWLWRCYSQSEAYQNRQVSSQVAQQHLRELERIFRANARRELSDFDLYVLWNAGPTYYGSIGWIPGRVHPVVRDRARRYANLRQRQELWRMAPWANARTAAVRPPAPVRLLSSSSSDRSRVSGTARAPSGFAPLPSPSLESLVIAHNAVFAATVRRPNG